LEDLLVRLDRVLDVGEFLEPLTRDRAPQLRARRAVRFELGEARLRRDEIARAVERLVDADLLADGVDIVRIELDELIEDGDERGVLLGLVAMETDDLTQ